MANEACECFRDLFLLELKTVYSRFLLIILFLYLLFWKSKSAQWHISNSSQGEEMAPQFTQMTLSRQGSSENPEPPPMYQAPPTVLTQHPPPQTSYIMATTGQPMPPPSGYQPATGHPHPPPPPPPPSQPVMQAPPPPQGYMQPPPPQQVCLSLQVAFSKGIRHGLKCSFLHLFKVLFEYHSSTR